jgi:hypothetical protein
MTDNLLTEWANEVEIPNQAWANAQEQVLLQLGIPSDISIHLNLFNIPTLQSGFDNWIRFLPDDAVQRLRTEDDLSQTILTFARGMYEAMQGTDGCSVESIIDHTSDDPAKFIPNPSTDFGYTRIETGKIAFITSKIIDYYSGNVNLSEISEIQANHEPRQPNFTRKKATILVQRPNPRNFVDMALFEVKDQFALFKNIFFEKTLMFEELRKAPVEPLFLLENVAFDWMGNSWGHGKTTPPSGPISFTETDHKNRTDFVTVNNPQELYDGCWGNLDEMLDRFHLEDRADVHHALVTDYFVLGA